MLVWYDSLWNICKHAEHCEFVTRTKIAYIFSMFLRHAAMVHSYWCICTNTSCRILLSNPAGLCPWPFGIREFWHLQLCFWPPHLYVHLRDSCEIVMFVFHYIAVLQNNIFLFFPIFLMFPQWVPHDCFSNRLCVYTGTAVCEQMSSPRLGQRIWALMTWRPSQISILSALVISSNQLQFGEKQEWQ